jgi:ERCC4-related helicase
MTNHNNIDFGIIIVVQVFIKNKKDCILKIANTTPFVNQKTSHLKVIMKYISKVLCSFTRRQKYKYN